MKVATQPHVSETAIAILENLPNQLGLANDSSQWGEQQLDQAIANLESACQFLKDFKKRFQKYMAGQVGACFDLTEQPKNWDDALKAALEWRKTMVERVRNDHLANAPDARDLLSVLDNNPHNFEQVFLNTLPHRLKLTAFEQWQTVRTNEEYLKRLRQAKADVEAKAIELKPSTVIEIESGKVTKPPIITPPPALARDSGKPQLETTSAAKREPGISTNSTGTDSLADAPSEPIEPPVTRQTPPVVMKTAVDEAFARITKIINQLSSKDQILLWDRLVNEYDPQ